MHATIRSTIKVLVPRLALVGLLGITSACTEAPKEGIRTKGEDPIILIEDSKISLLASITGILSYNRESKCINIMYGSAQSLALAIWPGETKPIINGEKRGVALSGGRHALEGDTITLAGGFITWGSSPPPGTNIPAATGCLKGNPEGTVISIGSIQSIKRPS